jgi:two-component system sensor histidine kinase/response regulator
MNSHHDVQLVVLSIAVAILASYTALDLAGRVTAARRGGRLGWLAAGAVAMGSGIWSMHFVAMLAFHLPVPITYDIPLALLSVLAAIAASALALFLVGRERLGPRLLVLGGICMGGGVGAMHYTGMAAIRAAARLSYDGLLVAASLAIAVTASMAALWLAFQFRHDHARHRFQRRTGAAIVMGFAIAGMHYTAMAAARFTPVAETPLAMGSRVLASGGLAAAVVLATLLILGLALMAAMMDRAIDAKNIELERLAAIVQSSDDAIVSTTIQGTILTWNSGAERLFGYTVTEMVGQPIWTLVPADDRRRVAEILEEIAGGGRIQNREVARTRKDGTSIAVSVSQSPIRNADGVITGISSIARDVTAQQRVQEAERAAREAAETASRAKSDFLANMSHEIRTPMNGVMGMLHLALDTELTAEQREYLEVAKTSTDALLAVINDILDFSKIEAGKLDLDPIAFQLGDSFADMLASLTLRAHAKGLELVLDIAPDIPDELVGDVGRLRQIVVNLVGNAIKFTERGEVVVRVSLESAAERDLVLHCAVADTGDGIPPEKQTLVFDAFAQADMSSTRRHGGTGLGLAISSRLTSLMSGRIWLESQVGRGSTFHFTAQVKRASKPASAPAPARLMELRGLRMLVVDDNATNRRILSELLTRWEAVPIAVDGGPPALIELDRALIAGTPFSLILLDAQMPEMDGFALAEQIFARPGLATATVMMLSSAGQRGDAARCREIGISAYLTKPIRPSELLHAMGLALQGRIEPQGAHLVTRHTIRESAPDSRPGLKILVAEDNPVNQQLAVRLLQKRGHTVVVAQDGQEALVALARDRFDLILMDVQMPGMGGFEATTAIRERERETGGRIPIVAMTARAMKGDREACLAAGMDAYVAKPISPKVLFDQIEALTNRGTADPAERALDRADLLARFDGDHVLLGELATIFLEGYPARFAAVRTAAERRDTDALEAAAHSLKGSVANFGAQDAVEAAQRLESMGRRGDLSGVERAVRELEVRMTRLTGELMELRPGGTQ